MHAEADRPTAYRIMIVEDDAKLSAILGDELRRFGHEVVEIPGDENVKEAAAYLPDLVLLDINLPRYDGFAEPPNPNDLEVPIIFISARSDDLDQVRALENGGDDYITKPFNLELCWPKSTAPCGGPTVNTPWPGTTTSSTWANCCSTRQRTRELKGRDRLSPGVSPASLPR